MSASADRVASRSVACLVVESARYVELEVAALPTPTAARPADRGRLSSSPPWSWSLVRDGLRSPPASCPAGSRLRIADLTPGVEAKLSALEVE
jgi:hypothetical protein